MKAFRTYQIAVSFYRMSATLQLSRPLRDQFARASASIVLNLAEGSGRSSKADQKRFYDIAFGSLRECQAVLDLADLTQSPTAALADTLAAHLFKLIRSRC